MIISRGVALYIVGLKKSFTDQFTEVMTTTGKEGAVSSFSIITNERIILYLFAYLFPFKIIFVFLTFVYFFTEVKTTTG